MFERQVELNPRIRYRAVDEDGVIVHLDNGRVIVVNDVGLYLLKKLSQPKSLEQLVESMIQDYEVDESRARADVIHYLEQLNKEQVVRECA